ncbi:MAG: hypothetical protein ACON4U_09060 [Myxococcota bacterium]
MRHQDTTVDRKVLGHLFDNLEFRLARMGSNQKFGRAERWVLGQLGYEKEREKIEEQERLHIQMVRMWDRAVPKSVATSKPYPLTQAELLQYRQMIEYDQNWRIKFSQMLAQAQAAHWHEPPKLPELLIPEDVASKYLPQFQSLIAENDWMGQWHESVKSYWHYDLFSSLAFTSKYSELLYYRVLDVNHAGLLLKLKAERIELRYLMHLSSDVAEVLLRFRGEIEFSGLLRLDGQTAMVVSKSSNQCLKLNGLVQLDDDVSEHLSRFQGRIISLNALKWIEPESALKLAQFGGESLHLNGLVALECESAKALLTFKGKDLSLNGLGHLEVGFIEALNLLSRKLHIQKLALNGVVKLSEAEAKGLCMLPLTIELNGLKSIAYETLKYLLRGHCHCSFNGLRQVSFEVFVEFMTHKSLKKGRVFDVVIDHQQHPLKLMGPFHICMLDKSPSPELMSRLNTLKCQLTFTAVTDLDIDIAQSLEDSNLVTVSFPKMETVRLDVLTQLACFSGRLKLNSMKKLSFEHAQCLTSGHLTHLELNGVQHLDTKVMTALTKFNGQSLSLTQLSCHYKGPPFEVSHLIIGLQVINHDALKPLINCASLELTAVSQLSRDDVKPLLKVRARQISFPAVKSLSHSVVKLLVRYSGRLVFKGVRSIDKRAAKYLAHHPNRFLFSPSIEATVNRHRRS